MKSEKAIAFLENVLDGITPSRGASIIKKAALIEGNEVRKSVVVNLVLSNAKDEQEAFEMITEAAIIVNSYNTPQGKMLLVATKPCNDINKDSPLGYLPTEDETDTNYNGLVDGLDDKVGKSTQEIVKFVLDNELHSFPEKLFQLLVVMINTIRV